MTRPTLTRTELDAKNIIDTLLATGCDPDTQSLGETSLGKIIFQKERLRILIREDYDAATICVPRVNLGDFAHARRSR